jgi:uncharacterized protein (DUF302 family)
MRSEWGLGHRLRRACWLGVACVLCSGGAKAETAGVAAHWVSGHAYGTVRAAVIEAIEGEGLVPSPPLDFADMLRRTGPALGRQQPLVERAEILQFCSARLAWQLLEEAPAQLALCPLSIAISQPEGESRILLSWRVPPGHSPGQQGVQALFSHLLSRIRAELP